MQLILKKYNLFVHNFDKKLLHFLFYGGKIDLSKGNEGERQKIKGGLKNVWIVGWLGVLCGIRFVGKMFYQWIKKEKTIHIKTREKKREEVKTNA